MTTMFGGGGAGGGSRGSPAAPRKIDSRTPRSVPRRANSPGLEVPSSLWLVTSGGERECDHTGRRVGLRRRLLMCGDVGHDRAHDHGVATDRRRRAPQAVRTPARVVPSKRPTLTAAPARRSGFRRLFAAGGFGRSRGRRRPWRLCVLVAVHAGDEAHQHLVGRHRAEDDVAVRVESPSVRPLPASCRTTCRS